MFVEDKSRKNLIYSLNVQINKYNQMNYKYNII